MGNLPVATLLKNMPVLLAHAVNPSNLGGRGRQMDICEFKASPVYKVSPE